MRRIRLTLGKWATVSDRDYSRLVVYNWIAVKSLHTWYAVRHTYVAGRRSTVSMHREVEGCKHGDGVRVDHSDGNGLHNWRRNLRKATHRQNMQNARGMANKTGYKGVSVQSTGRFGSMIKVDGRRLWLGTRDTPEEAHDLYLKAAIKYFGAFARGQ